ncbi:hypothetical protein GMRT_24168 [Giardia muris]|uniref:Uncharacterized protein n=1 Tax=Giardia muris TaxID=5742 RepID=A0A4Z1SNF8_GIAMU|nr:hypothetical protein GMRT_24168 [Giardia muris]|eukprot:TNJ27160.1 hypothetical protein GMRT_24168 [Giardia muris]
MIPFTHANHRLRQLKVNEPEKTQPTRPNPFKKRTVASEQHPRPVDTTKATIFKVRTKQTIGREGTNMKLKELVERTPLATTEKRAESDRNQTLPPSDLPAPGSPRTDSLPGTPLSQPRMKQVLFDDNLSDLD